MTAMMLTRTNEERDMVRFYKLDMQADAVWRVVACPEMGKDRLCWGVRIEAYPTRGKADLALILK